MHNTLSRMLIPVVLTVAGISMYARAVSAGDGCCAHCGCVSDCHKVCRLVDAPRKVTTICWGCKSEDFCISGPSQRGCKHWDTVCDDETNPDSPCVEPKRMVWWDWCPPCWAKPHTKNKLMKKTVTKTVAGYKWVVEDLCPQCQANCEVTQVPEGTTVPAPPKMAGAIMMPGEIVPAGNSTATDDKPTAETLPEVVPAPLAPETATPVTEAPRR